MDVSEIYEHYDYDACIRKQRTCIRHFFREPGVETKSIEIPFIPVDSHCNGCSTYHRLLLSGHVNTLNFFV